MKILTANLSARDLLDLISDFHACAHWGQSGEDAVLYRMFGDRRDGFYVDVGAHHPRRFSNTHLFHKRLGWTGINIDANADAISIFQKERPTDINLCTLVGFGSEPVTFTKFKRGARNTADPARAARLESRNLEVLERVTLKPEPLGSILNKHVPAGRKIDFMSVDVEGLDLQVLQSNDWALFKPDVVCVEDFDFRNGNCGPVWDLMTSVGYVRVSHCFDTSIYQAKK